MVRLSTFSSLVFCFQKDSLYTAPGCAYIRAGCGCSNRDEPSEHCTHMDACVRDMEADFFSRPLRRSGWNCRVSRRWEEKTKRRCWKDFGSACKHSAVSKSVSTPSCSSFPREGESLVRHRRPSEWNDVLCHPRAGYQYASHSSQVAPSEQGPLTGHLNLQNGGSGDPASLFPHTQTPGEEARGRS